MILNRTYKYSIVPNKKQRNDIESLFECSNDLFNRYLNDTKNGDYFGVDCYSVLKKYTEETPSLKDINRAMLVNTMYKIRYAINLEGLKERSKKNTVDMITFDYPVNTDNVCDYICEGRIKIPSIGNVKIKYHRELPINFSCRKLIVKRKIDKYYVLLNINYEVDEVTRELCLNKSIGIDYSPKHFFVDSNGYSVDMPRYLYDRKDKIKKEIQTLSKYDKGSEAYEKHKQKLNKLYNVVENNRNNFLHKLSNSITDDYDYICFETLNMNEFAQDKYLSKSTKENAFGLFEKMVVYKAKEKGKKVLRVSKWYPSTKICSVCGYKNDNLTLDDRTWTCPECNTTHDRDINAAINIKKEALKLINNNAVG